MTNTSGEINLQSKQDIICHLAKVKPATSAHYVAFSIGNIPFESNASIKPEKCISQTLKQCLKVLKRKRLLGAPDIYWRHLNKRSVGRI